MDSLKLDFVEHSAIEMLQQKLRVAENNAVADGVRLSNAQSEYDNSAAQLEAAKEDLQQAMKLIVSRAGSKVADETVLAAVMVEGRFEVQEAKAEK